MKKTILAAGAVLILSGCGGKTAEEADAPAAVTAEAPAPTGTAPAESEDALVAGTEYNATTILDCGFDRAAPTQDCTAGIKRNWNGEQGSHVIEVKKPDGMTRALFFTGLEPTGADSAQADGSAGWDFASTRDGDRTTIKFGPETYVVVDAMIEGG